ncbi:hypothetical protein D3C80_1956350 [compost metagenome]
MLLLGAGRLSTSLRSTSRSSCRLLIAWLWLPCFFSVPTSAFRLAISVVMPLIRSLVAAISFCRLFSLPCSSASALSLPSSWVISCAALSCWALSSVFN